MTTATPSNIAHQKLAEAKIDPLSPPMRRSLDEVEALLAHFKAKGMTIDQALAAAHVTVSNILEED